MSMMFSHFTQVKFWYKPFKYQTQIISSKFIAMGLKIKPMQKKKKRLKIRNVKLGKWKKKKSLDSIRLG